MLPVLFHVTNMTVIMDIVKNTLTTTITWSPAFSGITGMYPSNIVRNGKQHIGFREFLMTLTGWENMILEICIVFLSLQVTYLLMESVVLYIKNMVCDRCIRTVRRELEKLHWEIVRIELGKAAINAQPNNENLEQIARVLLENGFELIIDRESRIVSYIKASIAQMIHHAENPSGTSSSRNTLPMC